MNHLKENNDTFLARWLNSDISDEELKMLVSDKDFNAYVKIKKGLRYFKGPQFDSDILFQKISKNLPKKEKKVIKLNWFYAAAAIAVLFFSTYFYNNYLLKEITTNFNEQRTVILNDGSEAILNSKSFISYPKKWRDKRELTLKGEAFFKVRKGKSFTVNTQNGSVTVLGTQFNVNSQTDYFSVKCFEGKVMVIQNNDTIYLSQGNAYQSNKIKVDKWIFENKEPTWLFGETNFKSTPLGIVILNLETQFKINISKGNIDINQLYTGSFNNNNLNIALKSVFIPMEINYRIENNTVFLEKK